MAYKCKKDQAAASRKHYLKNKEVMKLRAKIHKNKARKRNNNYLKAYLRKNPCVDCGNTDIRVLDFDHVRGQKVRPVTRMADRAVSITHLQAEIDKCEIRCSNCHRISHWKLRQNNVIEKL